MVSGIYAQSAHSVYAIGNGNDEDDGGPTVVLHYNGHSWGKVAGGNFGYGTQPSQQIAPDGAGGLWLPMPGGGFTHASANPGVHVVAVILQYGS